MSRGNRKGGVFEREICVVLSEWWSKGKNPDVFWRSQGSGGRDTMRFRKTGKGIEGHDGDISAMHKSGRRLPKLFTVELKRGYGKTCVFDVLDRPKKKKNAKQPAQQEWESWIEQIDVKQKRNGTIGWLLIHRRDGRRPFIYYSLGVYEKLFNDIIRIEGQFLHVKVRLFFKKSGERKTITVMGTPLHTFLKAVDPDKIKGIYNEIKRKKEAEKEAKEEARRAEKRKAKKLQKA